jgi:hypothetical protein
MAIKPFRSACFFSTDNGATVQRRASAAEEGLIPLPSGITNLVRFDEMQPNNASVSADWATNSTPYTMAGNTLLKNGSEVGFDPPGLLYRALQNAQALFTKLESTPDALTREEQAQLGAISFRAAGLFV